MVQYEKVIEYHGYRQFRPVVHGAQVIDEHDREDEEVKALERSLAKISDIRPDNHHGWMVMTKEGRYLYLNFTDWKLYVWEMPLQYQP